jgi:hypothetical protein
VGEPPDRSGAPLYGLTPLPPDVSDTVGPGSGVTDGLAEPEGLAEFVVLLDGEAGELLAGDWLPQLAAGVGVRAAAWRDVLARGLGLALADALAEALAVGLAPPVGLAVALALALAALPFGLALALTVPSGLAVSLLWDGLAVLGDEVTLGLVGALVDAAVRVVVDALGFGELLDACEADGDRHGTADGLVIPGDALPSTPLVEEPWPVPPTAGELEVLLDEPANTSVLTWTNACRSGGTAASTTARANTATPTASAGLSMASRQSIPRRWAGRACPGPVPRPGVRPGRGGAPWPRGALCSPRAPDKCRTRPARTPEPHRPRRPPASGSVVEAKTGPDRIFSRIRSRPSGFGSTCSAAECSDRRTKSANSSPGPPSGRWWRRVMSPAPVPSAGRSCPEPCGSSPHRG